jgi:hypothetical protein
MITPADVQWASKHLAQLTEKQWRDAFRAATTPIRSRIVT